MMQENHGYTSQVSKTETLRHTIDHASGTKTETNLTKTQQAKETRILNNKKYIIPTNKTQTCEDKQNLQGKCCVSPNSNK